MTLLGAWALPQDGTIHVDKSVETEMQISAWRDLIQEETTISCFSTQFLPEHKVVGVTDSGVKQTSFEFQQCD